MLNYLLIDVVNLALPQDDFMVCYLILLLFCVFLNDYLDIHIYLIKSVSDEL